MTVSSAASKVIGGGNGVTTLWPFAFKVFQPGDIEVVYTDAAGAETILAPGDYVVQLNASQTTSPGGSVVYPASGAPIAAGTRLTIRRVLPLTQPTDLKNQGGFYPEIVETALDRLGMQVQQIDERGARALYAPASDPPPASLPAAARRAGKVLGFDAAGDPAVYGPASAVTDAANVTYTPAGGGAAPLTVESWIRDNRISVKDYGARGDGVTDDTVAVQATIDRAEALGGATVYFPPTPNPYRINGTLTIDNHGVCLTGDSLYTRLLFANGAADSIYFNGSAVGGAGICNLAIRDLFIDHVGKTGGIAIRAYKANQIRLHNVQINNAWNGFDLKTVNSIQVIGTIMSIVFGSYACRYWSRSDGTERSDVLTLVDSVFNCGSTGADGLVWEGYAHTLRLVHSAVLNARYGLNVKASSGTYFPTFLQATGMKIDGATAKGVYIEGGRQFEFNGCDIYCNATAAGPVVDVEADAGASQTASLRWSGGRIAGSLGTGLRFFAKDLILTACTISNIGLAGNATAPCIDLASGARDIQIFGNQLGRYHGAIVQSSFGVIVGTGCANAIIGPNNYRGCVVGEVSDNSSTGTVVQLGGIDKNGNLLIAQNSKIDGMVEQRLDNPSLGNSAKTRRTYSTGIASCYVLEELFNNAGNPYFISSAGSAVTAWYRDCAIHIFRDTSGTEIARIDTTRLDMSKPIRLKSYTVAGLPMGAAGDIAFASNGRKNGEGVGAGTGVVVFRDVSAWRTCDTGAIVAA